jgi:hypothetical protein
MTTAPREIEPRLLLGSFIQYLTGLALPRQPGPPQEPRGWKGLGRGPRLASLQSLNRESWRHGTKHRN